MPRGQRADIGSTRIAPNGYHYTKSDEYNWRLTHHIVAEENLDRRLLPHERVRFVDGDRTNISADNLEVVETKGGVKAKKIEIRTKIAYLEAELRSLEELE
tara:strand:+ start:174 stop:476 length:303 start_codon:yes stop_codon:yes gene_type:complete